MCDGTYMKLLFFNMYNKGHCIISVVESHCLLLTYKYAMSTLCSFNNLKYRSCIYIHIYIEPMNSLKRRRSVWNVCSHIPVVDCTMWWEFQFQFNLISIQCFNRSIYKSSENCSQFVNRLNLLIFFDKLTDGKTDNW